VRRQARAALEDRRAAALLKRVASTIDTARGDFGRRRRSALESLASFEPAHPEITAGSTSYRRRMPPSGGLGAGKPNSGCGRRPSVSSASAPRS
jgi:hypothetical protein